MATTTKFPQPIDHQTKRNLRMMARILNLGYQAEQSNIQTKSQFVTAINAG